MSHRRFILPGFIVLAMAMLTTRAADAANPPKSDAPSSATPSFPAKVELVVVDAAVIDKQGQPVAGLKRDDFIILEDGKPQVVSSFEAFEAPAAPPVARPVVTAPIRERVVANTVQQPRSRRSFIIVFDDVHLTPSQGVVARKAISKFVQESLREGDLVTLVTTGGAHWWNTTIMSGLSDLLALIDRLEGVRAMDAFARMSDFEALRITQEERIAVNDGSGLTPPGYTIDPQFEAPGDRPFEVRERVRRRWMSNHTCLGDCWREIDMEARRRYTEIEARSRMALGTLDRIMEALTAVPGRKSVLLVSAGFVWDQAQDGFKEVVAASRRANAAIYFVDIRGLQGLVGDTAAQNRMPTSSMDVAARAYDYLLDVAGAESVAHETGGFSVRNTNEFSKGMGRISDESRVYYLLGYYPMNTKRDGRFRKIEVKINRRDVEVRARRGYYASDDAASPPAVEADAMHPAMREALDSPVDQGGIPLRMTSYVLDQAEEGKARVLLVAEVEVSRLSFPEGEKGSPAFMEMQFVVALRDASDTLRYDERIEVAPPEDLTRENWWSVVREFALPPDVCQAKVVARDTGSGRVGSVTLRFEVPRLDELRVSTPILTDAIETPAEPSARPQPVLRAHRGFRNGAGSRLYCQFDVLGAATNPETGKTDVVAGYILVDKAGRPQRWSKPTPLAPSADGQTRRLIGIPIDALPPGEYELVLSIEDKVAGKTRELREPFSVI
jgi:VWFA-related protein